MGLFDSVTQLAGMSGGAPSGNAALLQGVMGLLSSGGSGGGLEGIVQGFVKSGLGDLASSWVGKGANLPISTEQLQKGLGAGHISQLAASAGLSEAAVASALATLLPTVIDKLTPDGAVPEAGQLQGLMSSVKGLFGG
ncbi:MAG: YidB family protein [Vicinamibacterales bacterium]